MNHRVSVNVSSPRTESNLPPLALAPAISFSSSPASAKATFVRRLLSVRVLLLVSFTLQVVIISAIVFGVVVYSQTKITDNLSNVMIQQVVGRVASIIGESFAITYLFVKGITYQLPSGNVTIAQIQPAIWDIWEQSSDALQDMYWGNPAGDCSGFYKDLDNVLYIMYCNKTESIDGYLVLVTNFTDGTGNLTAPTTSVLENYSVSNYAWYPPSSAIRNGEPHWSSIYKDPGFPGVLWLTCSIPLWDINTNITQGVISVDITSDHLSSELQNISVSKNAVIWIMEADGSLLACSNSAEQAYNVNVPSVVYAQESNLEIVRETTKRVFHMAKTEEDLQFTFDMHGKTINAYYHTIREYGLNFRLIVAYPQSDFFAVVTQAKTILYSVCLSVLVISLGVGLVVMHLITKPLTRLSHQMDFIAKGVFDDVSNPNTSRHATKLYEIHSLQKDFHRMVTALKSFGRFVPVDIVRYLLRSNTEATVSMSQKELTVMFSDIKNFTRKVEEMTPNQLSLMLSEYLNTMCSVISDTNGTVDKFIGDAIMALWNVPAPVEDHELLACQTALASLAALDQLNRKWTAIDLPEVGVRIGIHTGNALVGNLGSAERLAFTAVGDNINLAARLESLNKKYGTSTLISGEVYSKVKGCFLCRYLDVVVVVGRTQKTHIYELVASLENATEQQVRICEMQSEALKFFLHRDFEAAIRVYTLLINEMPDDISIRLLLERAIKTSNQESLPDDWTGYLVLEDK